MSNLKDTIKNRHGKDPWKDALFICAAVLMTALAVGSVTKKAQGHTTDHQYTLTVIENPELAR